MPVGVGIDLGSDHLKVVQVVKSGQTYTVTGALRLGVPPGQAKCPAGWGASLKAAGIRRKGTVGISGREVMMKYVVAAPMAPDKLRMYVDMQVADKASLSTAGQITYDFRLLNLPGGLKSDLVVMAAYAKTARLEELAAELRASGVGVTRFTPAAAGLFAAYSALGHLRRDETTLVLDVGAEKLEMVLQQERRLYFARSAPGGGRKFTQSLVNRLKIDFERAESYKRQRARLFAIPPKDADHATMQINSALRDGADAIAGAVRSALMFVKKETRQAKLDYDRVVLTGGGARLSGFVEYLERRVGRPVERLQFGALGLKGLAPEVAALFQEPITDMAVPLGLAIADCDQESASFALVPESLKRRRHLAGTVAPALAGAVLFAGTLGIMKSRAQKELDAARERRGILASRLQQVKTALSSAQELAGQNRQLRRELDLWRDQPGWGAAYLSFWHRLRKMAPQGFVVESLQPLGQYPGRLESREEFQNLVTLQVKALADFDDSDNVTNTLFSSLAQDKYIKKAFLDPRILPEPREVGGKPRKVYTFFVELNLRQPSTIVDE